MNNIKNLRLKSGNTLKPLKLTFISIDLDTGSVSIEESSSNKKIEHAPVGHYVHFCTMAKVIQLKRRFAKKPFLLEKFLNN